MTRESPGLLDNLDARLGNFYHPIATSQEVSDQPSKVRLLGQDWVVYRHLGSVIAFIDSCCHRHAPLSLGSCTDGILECAYHGWRFDAEGQCVAIPALEAGDKLPSKANLRSAGAAIERYGIVFISPKTPVAPLIEIDSDADQAFMRGNLPAIVARAHAGYLADNFLDMAHFGFLHKATFGDVASNVVEPYVIEDDDFGFFATYTHAFSNREDPSVQSGERPLRQRREMRYRYSLPFSLFLRLRFIDSGGTNVIGFFISPTDAQRCRLFTVLWRDDIDHESAGMDQALEFERKVLMEDLWLQERYEAEGFCLDATLEVHTKADKITLAMRRKLQGALAPLA